MKITTIELPLKTRRELSLAAETLRTGVPAVAQVPIVIVRPMAKPMDTSSEARATPKAKTRKRVSRKAMAQRLAYLQERTAHLRDNTQSWRQPGAVITADAVHPALTLEPRKAVPMSLPLLQRVERLLKGLKRVLIG
jgi:hypothetical protein